MEQGAGADAAKFIRPEFEKLIDRKKHAIFFPVAAVVGRGNDRAIGVNRPYLADRSSLSQFVALVRDPAVAIADR